MRPVLIRETDSTIKRRSGVDVPLAMNLGGSCVPMGTSNEHNIGYEIKRWNSEEGQAMDHGPRNSLQDTRALLFVSCKSSVIGFGSSSVYKRILRRNTNIKSLNLINLRLMLII